MSTESAKKHKSWQDYGRELLDTFVVAISVAMAFRAYFFEPFQIPTGSMQPTLYGNHFEAVESASSSVWDAPVLSFFKFLVTGTTYKEFKAPWSGELLATGRGDGNVDLAVCKTTTGAANRPGGLLGFIGGLFCENEMDNHYGVSRLPADAIGASLRTGQTISLGSVRKGATLCRGNAKRGDFIFVNRLKWNFFKPNRGEVMVFSTTGISGLPQGTHYIKRMTGLPGETVELREANPMREAAPASVGRPSQAACDIYIDGERIDPLKPEKGAMGEPTPSPCRGLAQYDREHDSVTSAMEHPVKLADDQYFALGDNSVNSADSRYWGPVPADNLRGNASFVFWPIINPRWGNIR